jgi:hypothetical protein
MLDSIDVDSIHTKEQKSQRSTNLVLTMSIGTSRNFLEITEKYMKNYSEKYKTDCIVLNDTSNIVVSSNTILNSLDLQCGRQRGGNAYYLKVLLINYYLNMYDKVLWLDDSCILSKHTENLFDMVEDGSIGAYNEGKLNNLKSWRYDYKFIQTYKNFKLDRIKYINSGVVVYTKKLKELFSIKNIILHKQLFKSEYPHQCYLNYILQSNAIPFVRFDKKYNDMFLHYTYQVGIPNNTTHIRSEYIRQNNSSIFHITGWWKHRYNVLKNIDTIMNSSITPI